MTRIIVVSLPPTRGIPSGPVGPDPDLWMWGRRQWLVAFSGGGGDAADRGLMRMTTATTFDSVDLLALIPFALAE